MKKNGQSIKTVLGLMPISLLVFGILFLPLLSMIADSFHSQEGNFLTFANYIQAFTKNFYLIAIKNSVRISLISTLAGIIAALLISYAITRYQGKVRENMLMIINMTTNFSGVALAFAYIILFGYSGILTMALRHFNIDSEVTLYTWTGVIMVYIYFQIPLGVLLLYPLYDGIREDWKQAAHLLGSSGINFWLKIGIPVMFPGIIGAFGILFANAMGSYATAYALVGGNYNMLTIRITSLISGDVSLQPQLGSALAVILAVIVSISVMLNQIILSRLGRKKQ